MKLTTKELVEEIISNNNAINFHQKLKIITKQDTQSFMIEITDGEKSFFVKETGSEGIDVLEKRCYQSLLREFVRKILTKTS